MNRSTIGRRYGLIPSLPSPHYAKFPYLATGSTLPPTLNHLQQFLPPVLDQGQVGRCTGMGTGMALATLLKAMNYKWMFRPSPDYIYAKVREFEGTPLTTDSGASIADVMTVINENGVAPMDSNPEWSWPFETDGDHWTLEPTPECQKDAGLHKLVNFMKVNQDVDSIKTALLNGYPVVIGISVFQSFESSQVAKTGVVPMPGLPLFDPQLGGHCLFAWGYGNYDLNHVDLRNSWGPDWGDKGDCHIPFSYLTRPDLCSDLFALEVLS